MSDLNPWQVMGRRPAPLAKLVQSENERLLAARQPGSAAGAERPPEERAPGSARAEQPPSEAAAGDG